MTSRDKKIIGHITKISFPEGKVFNLPAKVDTGAFSSAIHVSHISEVDGVLSFVLLEPSSPYYSGHVISTTKFKQVRIYNSFGHSERRYRVKLKASINGDNFTSEFTLAKRDLKSYPALVGRRLLNRFLVDVSRGGRADVKLNRR